LSVLISDLTDGSQQIGTLRLYELKSYLQGYPSGVQLQFNNVLHTVLRNEIIEVIEYTFQVKKSIKYSSKMLLKQSQIN